MDNDNRNENNSINIKSAQNVNKGKHLSSFTKQWLEGVKNSFAVNSNSKSKQPNIGPKTSNTLNGHNTHFLMAPAGG